MRRILSCPFYVLLTAIICLLPSVSEAQEQESGSSAIPRETTVVAMKYLRAVVQGDSISSNDGQHDDFIFAGNSRDRFGGWRVIVVAGSRRSRVLWDSYTLRDWYFDGTAPSGNDYDSDEPSGYIVTLRGCAPHQCADGRIGFALYSSHARRVYISHITTRDDGSYVVTYYPKSGIPKTYHDKLDQMMCSKNGVSEPSTLPIKCPTQ